MIKFNDGWEIDADVYSYILRYNSGKSTNVKGKETPVYTNVKYPRNLEDAVNLYIDLKVREDISKGVYDLKEAIDLLTNTKEKVLKMVRLEGELKND